MTPSGEHQDHTATSRVRELHDHGVSVWLDDLSRALIESGTLEGYIREHALSGVTSNPTIFARALRGEDDRYRDRLERLVDAGFGDPHALFFALALGDVHEAAGLLRDVYERTHGRDGYVSFECTPDVAHDASASVRQAEHVWDRVDAPNLIKVPATDAGIEAIERLTAGGINVNVTLLFGADRYEQAARAYRRGIERRARAGEPVGSVRSVASVFVSRIDAFVAELLGEDAARGSVAVANARSIHRRALTIFDEDGWRVLRARGANWQRPLWASTAPKSLHVRDVAYVEELALPDTIVTVPEKTLLAFADHGRPRPAVVGDAEHATAIADLARAGHDLETIGRELEAQGLRAFSLAYEEIIDHIRGHVAGHRRGEAA